MIRLNKYWIFVFILLVSFTACSKDDDDKEPNKEETIFDVIGANMEEWYLWNDELPNIDGNFFSDPNAYFESLLVDQDKWSFIANLDLLLAFFKDGTYTGYGFDIKYMDDEREPRVSLVYEESDLYTKGVTRSWKLTQIDNRMTDGLPLGDIKDMLSNSPIVCHFENDEGVTKILDLTKKQMNQNTVIKKAIVQAESKKVAYLVFDSFLDRSEAELNSAFDEFKTAGVEEIVLDFRYNGGGSADIANQLAGLISGNTHKGEVFSKYILNDSKSGENFAEEFTDQPSAINFERIFIITTEDTASASELIINSLNPYLGEENIILIGSRTHGKPVGMNVFDFDDFNLAIVPITFHVTDKNGEGYYFGGIPVDYEIDDDLAHDWGHPDETNLKTAIDYINNDNFPLAISKLKTGKKRKFIRKGLEELISAF